MTKLLEYLDTNNLLIYKYFLITLVNVDDL